MRKRGEVEWHKLAGEAEGIEVGIQHVGPGTAKEWALRLQSAQLQDRRRLLELRQGLTKEDAPELWQPGAMTPDGAREQFSLLEGILAECCAGIRGHADAEALTTGAERAAFLRYLGALEELARPAVEQQSLGGAVPLAAGPGGVAAERSPEAESGPGGSSGARASSRGGR